MSQARHLFLRKKQETRGGLRPIPTRASLESFRDLGVR